MRLKTIKKYRKQLSLWRDIVCWPGELFWDVMESNNTLNNWVLQDFYKFPQYGCKSRWETTYDRNWKVYWQWGSFPQDLRHVIQNLRYKLGRLIITKRQYRIIQYFNSWNFATKGIEDWGNGIYIRTCGKNQAYFTIKMLFGYLTIDKTIFTIHGQTGANVYMQAFKAALKGVDVDSTEDTERIFAGFVFTNKQYRNAIRKYRKEYKKYV